MPEEHSSSLLSSLLDSSFSVQLPSGNSLETEHYESSSSKRSSSGSGESMSSDDELRLMRAEAKEAAANAAAEVARAEQLNARIERRTLESELRSRSSRGSCHKNTVTESPGSHSSKGHKNTVTDSPASRGSRHKNTVTESPGSSSRPTVYEPVGSPPMQVPATYRGSDSELLQGHSRVCRE